MMSQVVDIARRSDVDMIPISTLDHLSNPLVTSEQLYRLRDDPLGYWGEHAQSVRFAQLELTQSAGVLLRLPQEVIANAIVILQRFWIHTVSEEAECFDLKVTSKV